MRGRGVWARPNHRRCGSRACIRTLLVAAAVVSIEDPFDQDDWESYAKLTGSVSTQIVGDDLLVTNPKRIRVRGRQGTRALGRA